MFPPSGRGTADDPYGISLAWPAPTPQASSPPAVTPDDGFDYEGLAASLSPEEAEYLAGLAPEAFDDPAALEHPLLRGIVGKFPGQAPSPPAPTLPEIPDPPPDARIPRGGALDTVRALGLDQPETWSGPPAHGMLWNTVQGLLAAPGAAMGAGLGALADRPGDLGGAARAAGREVLRLGRGMPATTLGAPDAPVAGTVSGSMTERGVEVPPGVALGVDLLGDPTNFGNPVTDALALGKAGLAVAAKAGAAAHAAVLFPNFAKAVKDAKTANEARGLYSRVDDVVGRLPAKGAHPNKVLSQLRSGASAEELAYRQLPEFLASKGNAPVTQADLAAHLEAHPAPAVGRTTRTATKADLPEGLAVYFEGTEKTPPSTPGGWTMLSDEFTRRAQRMQREDVRDRAQQYFALAEEATLMAEGLDLGRGLPGPQPKYAGYQLPGGHDYKETLFTLPDRFTFDPAKVGLTRHRPSVTQSSVTLTYDGQKIGTFDDPPMLNRATGNYETKPDAHWVDVMSRRFAGSPESGIKPLDQGKNYRSGHFSETPNVVVHTRSNNRTLPTGERGHFIEEIQSDWHQEGKKRGYKTPPTAEQQRRLAYLDEAETLAREEMDTLTKEAKGAAETYLAALGAHTRQHLPAPYRHLTSFSDASAESAEAVAAWRASRETFYATPEGRALKAAEAEADAAQHRAIGKVNELQREKLALQAPKGVPDAPFKETWPDLALKQHLLDAAADPEAEWLGFTSGATQADRYDLSKQISEVRYSGTDLVAWDHDGEQVFRHTGVTPEELPDYIGKEAADRLLKQPKQGTLRSLSGLDLQVGGEGMKHFYDELLPKRLEKLVKPFGATVEQMTAAQTGNKDLVGSWIVRLSPEQKAAIVKQGLPLMGVAGAAALDAQNDDGDAPLTAAALGLAAAPLLAGKGLAAAVRAEKLARAAIKGAPLEGRALGSMAATLKKGGAPGEYALRNAAADRVASLYKIGTSLASESNWAGAQSRELLHAFGGDEDQALRWARMWGATSPNTSATRNTQESVSALLWSLEHPGEAFTKEIARTLPKKITMAGSKVPNLNHALAGEGLSGDKVEAMAAYMAGHSRIPIDVHALYGVGSAHDKLGPEMKDLRALMTKAEKLPARGGLTKTEIYMRYEEALRRTLQEIAPGREVNPVFAEFWEGVRAHKGLANQGGPIDMLRGKGLLEAGAMLDPAKLREALAQSRWSPSAIAGLMLAIGATGATLAGNEGEAAAARGPS